MNGLADAARLTIERCPGRARHPTPDDDDEDDDEDGDETIITPFLLHAHTHTNESIDHRRPTQPNTHAYALGTDPSMRARGADPMETNARRGAIEILSAIATRDIFTSFILFTHTIAKPRPPFFVLPKVVSTVPLVIDRSRLVVCVKRTALEGAPFSHWSAKNVRTVQRSASECVDVID